MTSSEGEPSEGAEGVAEGADVADVIVGTLVTASVVVAAIVDDTLGEGLELEGAPDVDGAGPGGPASASCCATKVVDSIGHPTPIPLRFWSVMDAAVSLSS